MVSAIILQRTFRSHTAIERAPASQLTGGADNTSCPRRSSTRNIMRDTTLVLHQGSWKRLQVNVVGIASPPLDVAVLAAPLQLSVTHALPAGTDGLYLSQDVYFLGFPYGMQIEVGPDLNRDCPLPLEKKGIVTSMEFSNNSLERLLLDRHNNPGFSGGPVVYIPTGTRDLKVAGIISGYRYEWSQVYSQGEVTPMALKENTGIVVAYPIGHATKLIEANPVGFLLDSSGTKSSA